MPRLTGLFFRRLIACLTIVSQLLTPLYYAGLLNPIHVEASDYDNVIPIVTNTQDLQPLSIWDQVDNEAAATVLDTAETVGNPDRESIAAQLAPSTRRYASQFIEEYIDPPVSLKEIRSPENMLGREDSLEARISVTAPDVGGHAQNNVVCFVVGFNGVFQQASGVAVLARQAPEAPQSGQIKILLAATNPTCSNNDGWTMVGMTSVVAQKWHSYGISNTLKNIRYLKIIADSTSPNPFGYLRAFNIDAIQVTGNFVPDDNGIEENQTTGDQECDPCDDANTAGQTQVQVGRPINPLTGNYAYSVDDLTVQGIGQPLVFRRSYAAKNWQQFNLPGDNLFALGRGWTHNYNLRVIEDAGGGLFIDGDGSVHKFFTTYAATGQPSFTFEKGFLATLSRETVPGGFEYTMVLRNQTRYKFFRTSESSDLIARVNQIDTVASGGLTTWNPVVITYDALHRIDRISSGERYLAFKYDGDTEIAHISEVYDHRGGCDVGAPCVHYQYTNYYPDDPLEVEGDYLAWRLSSVTDLRGKNWTYLYGVEPGSPEVSLANLIRVVDPLGNTVEQQSYSSTSRVTSQWNGENQLIGTFDYVDTRTVRVTDGRGNTLVYHYDNQGALASIGLVDSVAGTEKTLNTRDHSGTQYRPQAEGMGSSNVVMNWSADGYTLESVTAAPGTADEIITSYTYGEFSNVESIATPGGRLTRYLYEDPRFPTLPTTVVDALNNRTTFTYTADGFLETITNAENQVTRYSYDAYGQRTEMITNYVAGQAATADQNLRTRFVYDNVGRLILTQDPLQRCTATVYDAAGNVTRTVENLYYCEPDNLWEFIVSAAETATHQTYLPDYDIITDRVYDDAGRLIRVTDTLGRVTVYEYDGDSRVTRIIRNYVGDGTYNSSVPDQNISTGYTYDAAGNVTTITDVSFNQDWICYDALNRANRFVKKATGNGASPTTDPCNAASYVAASDSDRDIITSLVYDDNSNITDIYHPDGTHTKYVYDVLNRQTAVVRNYQDGVHDYAAESPDQDVIALTYYDEVGNISRTVDPAQRVTAVCYDKLNRQTRTIVNVNADPNNRFVPRTDPCTPTFDRAAYPAADQYLVTDTIYDSLGRVRETLDPLGRRTIFQYDAVGHMTRQISNYVDGFISSSPDEDVIQEIRYDQAGRAIEMAEVYFENGQEKRRLTCLTYDQRDQKTSVIANCQPGVEPGPDVNVTQLTAYDSVGRVVSQTDPNNYITVYAYDNLDRLLQVTDPAGHATKNYYDGQGNLYSIVDALNHTIGFNYDYLNRQVETLTNAGTTRVAYDRMGNVTSRTDANQVQTRYEYDHLGRLSRVLENFSSVHPFNDPAAPDRNVQTEYTYDTLGNVLTIGLPGTTAVSYSYDRLNRRTRINGSLAGDIDVWGTTYDKGGRVMFSSSPNGQTQSLSYDGLDRLKTVNYSDQATADVNFVYDTLGRRTQMTDGLGTTQYGYDPLDRITQLTDPLSQTLTYEYDAGGRRVGLHLPGSRTIDYTYDEVNRLTNVSDWDTATTNVTYNYDDANRITGMTLPNGVAVAYTYDDDNRLIGMRYQQGTQTLAQFDYGLDAVGNRLRATEQQVIPNQPPVADAGPDQTYTDTDGNNSELVNVETIASRSTDSDGSISSWTLSENGVELTTSQNTQAITLTVGAHTLMLTVTDDDNATDTDEVIFTITPPVGPFVRITTPSSDVRITNPEQTRFQAEAWDARVGTSDGAGIQQVQFELYDHYSKRQINHSSDTTAPYCAFGGDSVCNTAPNDLLVGSYYSLLARTQAADGTWTAWTEQPFMNNGFNDFPTARAGYNQTVTDTDGNGTEIVTLDGSRSSYLPAISNFIWKEMTPGSSGDYCRSLDGTWLAAGVNPQVELGIGRHTLVLSVIGKSGFTDGACVDVTVNALAQNNNPPVANAGGDQTVITAGTSYYEASVTLDGSGSRDSDGTITTYTWLQNGYSRPEGMQPQSTFSEGIHRVTLRVTDDKGATANDGVVIRVVRPGRPLADAGADQTILDMNQDGSETVTLDGAGSFDTNGSLTNYVWKEKNTQIATGASPQVSLTSGFHVLTLTVTDNEGLTSTDTILISVVHPNQPPIANAGPDQVVVDWDNSGSETVQLDSSGSSDADSSVMQYKWIITFGSSLYGYFTGGDWANPRPTQQVGTLTYRLTVTDDYLAKSSDEVTIQVTEPEKPLANAGPDQTILTEGLNGQNVTLDGTGSRDSAGELANYIWTENGTEIGFWSTPVVYLEPGVHTITLTVTDDEGATATDEVVITVGQPPTANAGSDQVFTTVTGEPAPVTLDGSASTDSDGTISSYGWHEGKTQLGSGATLAVLLQPGVHTITLTVTDNHQITATDEVVITVNAPPTANAGPDQFINITSGDSASVQLDGSGSQDGDGAITSYRWQEGETILATNAHPLVTFNLGVHTITLTVTDEDGLTSTDTVQITVDAEPLAPGHHEQDNGRIGYTGATWTTGTNASASGQTYSQSTVQDATIRFRFEGTGLILYRTTGPAASGYGSMEVCVDTTCKTISNVSTAVTWQNPAFFADLSNGIHVATLRNLEVDKLLQFDAVKVYGVPTPLPVGSYEHTADGIQFFGDWKAVTNAGAHDGSYLQTSTANDLVEFQIEGNAFTLYRTVGSGYGSMEVCIDGNCQSVSDLAGGAYQKPVSFTGLGDGVHTVRIRNLAATIITFDWLEVHNLAPLMPITPGTQEQDQTTYFRYLGSGWTTLTNTSVYSGGTLIYTTVPGDLVEFAFDGTAFKLYRTLASGYGELQVCIDGSTCYTVSNAASSSYHQQPLLFSDFTDGIHTVTLRSLSNKQINLDKVEVTKGTAVFTPSETFYDDTNASIAYGGAPWYPYTNASANGSSYIQSNVLNATIRFRFEGIGLTLYRTTGPATGYGSMEVCIDDNPCRVVSNVSSSGVWKNLVFFSDLSNGSHTVTIRNLEAGKALLFDAFKVQGAAAPLQAGIPHEETDPGFIFYGNWNPATAGTGNSVMYTGVAENKVEFAFDGTAFILYRTLAAAYGDMEVCIDGSTCYPVSNVASATYYRQPLLFSNFADGIHTVSIRNLTNKNIALDMVEVLKGTAVLTPRSTNYEDTDVNIAYGVTPWYPYTNASASGSNYIQTKVLDATIRFQFEGTGLTLYRTTGPNTTYGSMEVCIDTDCQPVSNVTSAVVWKNPVFYPALSNGTHTVTIRNLETGKALLFDALRVYGTSPTIAAGSECENTETCIQAFGNWTQTDNASASGGNYLATVGANDFIQFQIDGNAFTVHRTLGSGYGSMRVCIDGEVDTDCEVISTAASTLQYNKPVTFTGLSSGVHSVRISNAGSTTITFDKVTAANLPDLVPLTALVEFYDDNDPASVKQYGAWTPVTAAGAYNGAYTQTNLPGDLIEFAIDGGGVTLYRTTGSGYGTMRVCVDAAPCYNVSNVSTAVAYQQPVVISDLGPGIHRIRIRNLANTNATLDKIEVAAAPATLEPGTYEQTSDNIAYGGGLWYPITYTGASGQSYIRTNVQNATIEFSFNGTALTLYRTTSSGYSNMEVCFDEATTCYEVTNSSTAAAYQQPVTLGSLSAGVHTVRIRNLGTSYITFDSIKVHAAPTPLGAGLHQHDLDAFVYGNAPWYTLSSTGAYEGKYTQTSALDATITFSFEGTGVTIYRVTNTAANNYGTMDVCIDGICESKSNVSSALAWKQPITYADLSNGLHTVQIRNTSGKLVVFDAVQITAPVGVQALRSTALTPTPLATVLTAGRHEETAPALIYTGQWQDYSGSEASGQALRYTTDPEAQIQFAFEGNGVILTFTKRSDSGQKVICLDGACQLIDNYSPTTLWQQPVAFMGLDEGRHEIIIRNAAATYGDLDAVLVRSVNAPEPTVMATPTVTATALEVTVTPTLTLTETATVLPTVTATPTPVPALLPFVETFESGQGWNASGVWSWNTQPGYQGTGWFADTTQRNQISALVYNTGLDLRLAIAPALSFWQKSQLAPTDQVTIEVMPENGSVWLPVDLQTGLVSDWTLRQLDLSAYRGQVIRLRVRVDAIGSLPEGQTSMGYWLDELMLAELPPTPVVTVTAVPTELPTLTATPTALPTLLPTELPSVTPEPTLAPTASEPTAEVTAAVVAYWPHGGKPLYLQSEVTPEATSVPETTVEPTVPVETATPEVTATPEAGQPTPEATIAVEVTPELFPQMLALQAVATTVPPTRTIFYNYDKLYRLTAADYCEGLVNRDQCQGAAITQSYDYTYDLRGNRTNVAAFDGTATVNTVYTYNQANQILTEQIGTDPVLSFVYDPNGNLVNDGVNRYAYDAANRLVAYTANFRQPDPVVHTYTYNGLGDRYRQTVGGVQTNYLLDLNSSLTQVVGEFQPGSDTYYLLGLDVIGQQQNSTWSYFGYDGLGSVRQLVDAAGTPRFSAGYDPYGTLTEQMGDLRSGLGFTGEQSDPSGLLYLRARYANLAIGTFLSRDPVLGAPGMSLSYNGYLYVHGNPVNLTDPSGKFVWFGAAAGFAIGGAVSGAVELASQLAGNGGNWECLDTTAIGVSMLEGAVMGAVSGGFGFGAVADFAFGVGWDMAVHGESLENALINGAVGAVTDVGTDALMAGAKRLGKAARGALGDSLGRAMRGADNAAVDAVSESVGDAAARAARGADDAGTRALRESLDIDTPERLSADVTENINCRVPNSFSEDTPVATEDGEVPISEIEVGDEVLAYNEATGETGEYTVTDTFVHLDPVIIHLVIDGELIETTPEHPFFANEGQWLYAKDLRVGDFIWSVDGSGTVESITVLETDQWMYNLTVDEAHTFYVGDGQWLVHNACPGRINVGDLRFTQDTASSTGPIRGTKNSYTVQGNADELSANPAKELDAIYVFQKTEAMNDWGDIEHKGHVGNANNLEDGLIYTLDNRRLESYRRAKRETIPVIVLDPTDPSDLAMIKKNGWKFTTDNEGVGIKIIGE